MRKVGGGGTQGRVEAAGAGSAGRVFVAGTSRRSFETGRANKIRN